MARVFDQETVIDFGAELIPDREDFEYSIDAFYRAMDREVKAGGIDGGAIFGSVAIRAYNVRSDFDCMIVPYDHSAASLEIVGGILSEVNPDGRMSVGAIVHPKRRLASGDHEIDRYFGQHLTGSHRMVVGNDPANYMRFPEGDPRDIVLGYIRHKKRSIASAYTALGQEHVQALQRILELPLAIGRKALMALDEVEGTDLAVSDSADKARVRDASRDFYDKLGLGEVPERIMMLDREYTKVFKTAADGEITRGEYIDFLKRIKGMGGVASEWLDQVDVALQERLTAI